MAEVASAADVDENQIRELVHNCMDTDDITSLLRLMFDSQARATREGGKVANLGKDTVSSIHGCLERFSAEQERVIDDVARANSTEISQCVEEMHQMRVSLKDLNTAITSHSDELINAGRAVVRNTRDLRDLQGMQENMVLAATATRASQKVLDLCLEVARHIEQHQLYQALCLLVTIRTEHLPSLLTLIASSNSASISSGMPSSPQKATSIRRNQTSAVPDPTANLRLRVYFEGLVEELSATIESLAIGDFNNWLVAVRADARQIGMRAIRKAATERQLEEDLSRERKMVLQQLTEVKDVTRITGDVVQVPFRKDILQDSATLASTSAPEQSPPSHPSLRLSSKGSNPKSTLASRLAQTLASVNGSRTSLGITGSAARQSVDGQMRLLDGVDMRPLHRCVHIQACMTKLVAFQQRYLEQRQLQITTDLQAPGNFLEAYQGYLAQVTGFFIVEDCVQRVAEGLVSSQQVHLLWEAAAGTLKTVLERSVRSITSTSIMLLVKDFVLLMCTALAQCGYNVLPVQEILLSSRTRYHDLLAKSITSRINNTVDADVLMDYQVRNDQQHQDLVKDLGLPACLEGSKPQEVPYYAPYTGSIPAIIQVMRGFVLDSLSYLRGMFGPWELLPAVYQHRDAMLNRVVVAALTAKVSVVNSAEMLKECMKMVTNVWSLIQALDAIDAWTVQQVRPLADKDSSKASMKSAKGRKAMEGVTSTVQASLRSIQDVAERNMLRLVAARVEALLDASRAIQWLPSQPLPTTASPHINQLLSFLQETFDAAQHTLPRSSFTFLARTVIRSAALGFMRTFTGPEVKAFNSYSLQRLAGDVAAVQRFAAACPVSNLAEELAEPCQLCGLLLSANVEDVLAHEVRKQKYPALELAVVALMLDKYKEVGGSNRGRESIHVHKKKTIEQVAKSLREQMLNGASTRYLLQDD